MATLKADVAAYFDSFWGFIPCKVLSVTGESGPSNWGQEVTVRITESRGPYTQGEIMRSNAMLVVPRDAVEWREHGATIRPYSVECS